MVIQFPYWVAMGIEVCNESPLFALDLLNWNVYSALCWTKVGLCIFILFFALVNAKSAGVIGSDL